MRALILSRYDRKGASSRLRFMQFQANLDAMRIESDFSPFFTEEYLGHVYAGTPTGRSIGKAYMRRLLRLAWLRSAYTVVWIEKEAFPWWPWPVERVLLPKSIALVVDYDDAIYHRYDLHPSSVVRRLLGRKIDRLMAVSDLVTAGNSYLAERARSAGARWVEVIPTVVDLNAYTVCDRQTQPATRRIGWIGTPSTWTEYMAPMMPLLSAVAALQDARIMAVGAGRAAAAHPVLENLPWSEETEVTQIQAMDIGIMPLTDTPWSRGKCGYKLLQYMACGLPVVASPVGVNAEIVEHGVNGFLASTEAEWNEALTMLLRDPALRARMGQAGRKKVEAEYSLQVWGPRVAAMLRDVADQGRRR